MNKLEKRIEQVREALHEAGHGLPVADWKELLEEIHADIEGHLEAIREEQSDDES